MTNCIRGEKIIFYFYYYRPQTKFAKVMFLQVSVCPQGEGHAWLLTGGVRGCSWGACVVAPGGGHAWLLWGGEHAWEASVAKGGHVWQRGMCMVKGGMRGEGGMCGEGGRAW